MRLAKITSAILAAAIIIGFAALAINSGAVTKELNFKAPKLQSTQEKLNNLNVEYNKLNNQMLQLHSSDKEQIKKLDSEKQQLEQQRQDLQKQLQAKLEAKKKLEIAAANAVNTVTATSTASAAPLPTYEGSHEEWMRQAGIDPSNFGYVDYIVSHESGWDPNAINPNGGACGLGQQLPCGKWAGAWNDPVSALRAMNSYVVKFGGWGGAYTYWQAHGNY